jgi:hypothetical protein
MFTARAWKNGRITARPTLGLAIRAIDRDTYFRRGLTTVSVRLPGTHGIAVVNLSPTFWTTCPELRSATIGAWLRTSGAFPWRRGEPPRYWVRPEGRGLFTVERRA